MLDFGDDVVGAQGPFDGAADEVVDEAGVGEFHLVFGGMDVDVDALGIDLHKDEKEGEMALGQALTKGRGDRVGEGAVVDVAVVEKKVLVIARLAHDVIVADVAGDGHQGAFVIDLDEVVTHPGAEDVGDAVGRRRRGIVKDLLVVVHELETDLRKGEGETVDHGEDGAVFGALRAQKFAPGGRVEEEGFHGDGGAGVAAADRHFLHHAALDENGSALHGAARHGAQFDAGDGGNGGQRFAAESEGADALKVGVGADLGGGVALQGEDGVFLGHAQAVVNDLDEGRAAAFDDEIDLMGIRIDAVLHQFLDHRGRAVDDLPCGDLVDEIFGQNVYFTGGFRHGIPDGWRRR